MDQSALVNECCLDATFFESGCSRPTLPPSILKHVLLASITKARSAGSRLRCHTLL